MRKIKFSIRLYNCILFVYARNTVGNNNLISEKGLVRKMKSGLVILNYNSWEMTKNLALLVAEYKAINYVIVIDNCSSDNSYEHLKKIESEKILVKQSSKNGGYSYGNNYGAVICDEVNIDIMFVVNPDVYISEKNINFILEQFSNNDYSLLTGVEYDIDKNISVPPIWNFPTYGDDIRECFFLGRKCMKERLQNIRYDVCIQDIDIFKGSFFAIRLDDFKSVGGFDENVFLFCEERILSHKLLESGKKIGLVTSVKYYHNHSYSINNEYKNKSKQMQLLYKSRMYYYQKYEKITSFEKKIMKLCMGISIIEYTMRDVIKNKIGKVGKIKG